MFNLFGKRPSRDESVRECSSLARAATIDVALEKGEYAGFLIRVDADGPSLAPHFKNPEARSAFVQAIEARIEAGEFNDPGAGLGIVEEGRRLSGWKITVVR